MRALKTSLLLLLILTLFAALCGCGHRIDTTLPEDPLEFRTCNFVNPADPDDAYQSIEYRGRTYIPYGALKGRIDGNDVGACLGYPVQDGVKQEDIRICLLRGDPDANYLVRIFPNGIMDQPDFFRATDTQGKEIDTPRFIDSLGYAFWD